MLVALVQPTRPLLSPASWTVCPIDRTERLGRITPRRIGRKFFSIHEDTLKPSLFHLATVFFTIEGHDVGYQTDEVTTPIPFGVNYVLQVHVAGENLAVLPTARFLVKLNAWDRIDVRPFDFLNLLAVAYDEWKNSDSRWVKLFRRIKSYLDP